MDKELKQKWVAALRSGEYAQGNGALKDESGRYCCLGVLTVCIDETAKDSRYLSGSLYLTVESTRKSGLPTTDQRALAYMNDSGKSFPDIATYIEENL